MGGEVGVDSRPGEGSTFWLELALSKMPDGEEPASPATGIAGHSLAHVLLAEDDVVNQMVVGEMLRKLGCEVDVVGDGAAAREAASQRRYDLVFMDCHMPVMDGFEATRLIREDERDGGGHVPIVALTADARPRALPRIGHGRPPDQAGEQRALGRCDATLDRPAHPVAVAVVSRAPARCTGLVQRLRQGGTGRPAGRTAILG
jgi:CheY-like chemotaxis protein